MSQTLLIVGLHFFLYKILRGGYGQVGDLIFQTVAGSLDLLLYCDLSLLLYVFCFPVGGSSSTSFIPTWRG